MTGKPAVTDPDLDGVPVGRVERRPIPVMFLEIPDEVEAFAPAWERLETAVGPLRGRRFYGAFWGAENRYRVCAEIREGDDPAVIGLETFELPGGPHLRAQLKGEAPAVYGRIGLVAQALRKLAPIDDSLPGVEFYRRHGEIDILLPVLANAG